MYLFKLCFLVNRVIRFITWKAKIKMAVTYMFKENALDSIYAFILLQYRRPRTVMQMANYFVTCNNFDEVSKEAFFKEVYKVKMIGYAISTTVFALCFFLMSYAIIWGIKRYDSLCIAGGIAWGLISLIMMLGLAYDCRAKRKEMKAEMKKYIAFKL